MASFKIIGGLPLKGEIIAQGAKNEALQVICATLLTDQEVIIRNIPEIADILNLIKILKFLGVQVKKIEKGTYSFQAKNIKIDYLKKPEFREHTRKLRGSVMLMGPLLARYGEVFLPTPGGDKIGRRRLDTHFNALEKLGVKITYDFKNACFTLKTKTLKGNYILLDEASVTGTANIMMAAAMAKGTTTIYNAACEPYNQQLAKMLVKMGAKIDGIGSNLLTIQGTDKLNGCEHTLLPDMIEVGSFIGLAAATQSDITIKNAGVKYLGIIPQTFEKLGIKMNIYNDDIHIPKQELYEISTFMDGSILTISDAPWPGLSPDLLSIILVVSTLAKGSILIHQKMFESRLFFVDKLIDMGAKIILCDPHRAVVIGNERKYKLRAANMTSPDIRAGVALLIAALTADGISIIHNIEQIDRGYYKIEQRLNALGANITRIP